MIRRSLVLVLFAACGGGDDDDAPVDMPQQQSTLMEVTPCAGESATVTADNATFVYNPAATTINQGQIVKFVMPSFHNVAPKTAADDPGLSVNFNTTKCIRFTSPGTFNFKCTPHGFAGAITVN